MFKHKQKNHKYNLYKNQLHEKHTCHCNSISTRLISYIYIYISIKGIKFYKVFNNFLIYVTFLCPDPYLIENVYI